MNAPVQTEPAPPLAADPRSDPRWAALARGPRGHLFISPPWIDAVCRTYGFEPHARVMTGADGTPAGGFAWVLVDDLLGERVLSLPFCERADPPVDDLTTWEAVTAEPLTLGAAVTVRVLETPDNVPLRDPRLVRTGLAAWHGTALDAPVEEIWTRFDGSARRNVRTAERKGVEVVASEGLEAVRRFHDLHVSLRKTKYRLLAQPMELFERIWHAFAPNGGIVTLLAMADGVPIAGGLYLEWAGTLYHKFGASRMEYRSMCPNNAITWTAIRWAAERGLDGVDWGLSDLDQPGLLEYKRQWASTEQRIVTLCSAPPAPTRPGGGDEARALLGELSSLLTDPTVPDEVAARAGGLLYRYFC